MLDITPLKFEDDKLLLLDQTRLPNEEVWFEAETKEMYGMRFIILRYEALLQSELLQLTDFM